MHVKTDFGASRPSRARQPGPGPRAGPRKAPSSTPTSSCSPPASARATRGPRSCGLAVGDRGGVPSTSAAARPTSTSGRSASARRWPARVGLVGPGYPMAEVVADQLVGEPPGPSAAVTCPRSSSSSASRSPASATRSRPPTAVESTFTDQVAGVHPRLVLGPDGRVAGGILVGDAAGYGALAAMVAGALPTPSSADLPGQRRRGDGRGACPTGAVCSCNNVVKGALARRSPAAATTSPR